ncbi:MAG: CBS domain-containing protein [Planctomycetota bacterium]|nr:CBS domain-containing protein [Planctomycetota bacterium]
MTSKEQPRKGSVADVLRKQKLHYLEIEDVAMVKRGSPLREALTLLQEKDSRGAALVVEEKEGGEGPERKPVGIFTERDYLDKLAGVPTDLDRPIDEYMTANPQTVLAEDTCDVALRLMTKGGYRHLPVVDRDGALVGLVSTRDIVVHLAEFFPMEVYNLPPRLHQNHTISPREGG